MHRKSKNIILHHGKHVSNVEAQTRPASYGINIDNLTPACEAAVLRLHILACCSTPGCTALSCRSCVAVSISLSTLQGLGRWRQSQCLLSPALAEAAALFPAAVAPLEWPMAPQEDMGTAAQHSTFQLLPELLPYSVNHMFWVLQQSSTSLSHHCAAALNTAQTVTVSSSCSSVTIEQAKQAFAASTAAAMEHRQVCIGLQVCVQA